jgi:nucleoside-diphosphate-sugar epimerase
VVVDGYGQGALGAVLSDDVLVQDVVDLARLRKVLELEGGRSGELFIDDLVAEVDALVADIDAGAGDQLLDLALRLAAEAAEELLVGFGGTCQRITPSVSLRPAGSFLAESLDACRPRPCGISLRRERPVSSQKVSLASSLSRLFSRSTQRRQIMRIFVAGATGALGRQLLPKLVEHGHEVTGMTRTPEKASIVEELGARAAIADALDAEEVASAVANAEPEVIVHELTSISDLGSMRNVDRAFETTNRLRTEGTDHLLAAGKAIGVQRFVAQSFAAWLYERVGGPVKTEDDPLDPEPIGPVRETFEAIRYVENAVTGADWTVGIALRYGGFYGPGTSIWSGGEHLEPIRQRKFPVVGNGAGVWSFIHIEDAADATLAAVERGDRGVYNVVDDSPEPVRDWLPGMAEMIGAPPPRRVPKWLGRVFAGRTGVIMMTELRGQSNAKAKRELGWAPRHPSWRDGLAELAAGPRRSEATGDGRALAA